MAIRLRSQSGGTGSNIPGSIRRGRMNSLFNPNIYDDLGPIFDGAYVMYLDWQSDGEQSSPSYSWWLVPGTEEESLG
jgi:hypothetical protein